MSLSGYSSSSTQSHRSTDLGSTRQPTESAPNVALHSFPSPPLSSTNSPITYLPHHPDPWFERSSRLSDQEMELSTGSVSGLEGSWRMEGEVLPRGKWEIRDTHLEGERRSKMPRGVSPDKGARPLGIAVMASVMASVMDTSKGRDKILKIAQYSMRTYLYLLSLVAGVRPLPPWFTSNSKRLRLAVSSLSLTRKCFLLLNPLHPLTHLLSPAPTSASTLIRHLIDLTSALADDIYCLSRLGIVGRRTGRLADRWANRFWFLNTLIALYTLHLRTIPRIRSHLPAHVSPDANEVVAPAQTSRDIRDAEWTNRKLLADLAFVSYDIFRLAWFKEPVQCAAGLLAALISSSKLYDQHWRAILGKG